MNYKDLLIKYMTHVKRMSKTNYMDYCPVAMSHEEYSQLINIERLIPPPLTEDQVLKVILANLICLYDNGYNPFWRIKFDVYPTGFVYSRTVDGEVRYYMYFENKEGTADYEGEDRASPAECFLAYPPIVEYIQATYEYDHKNNRVIERKEFAS